jgi:dihydrofolate synthase/folylpolyglutamate synthase
MTNFSQSIEILTSQGKFHICLGLERISHILELLENPQDNLKIIHVAGTNGKGSVCSMLSSILAQTGYTTGLYTSPHIVDYTERIKINNKDISREDFSALFEQIHEISQKNDIHLTEFEILTAMAFEYFSKQNTDIVILETGLGGRLDATNVVKSTILSIITSIDKDHEDRLGDTIDKIAYEKSGIIKENKPVITVENNNGIETIQKIAEEKNSPFIKVKNDFEIVDKKNNILSNDQESYELALRGVWNTENLALVISAVNILKKNGFSCSEKDLRHALKNTSWQSRFQFISEKNILIDGAHNPASAQKLRESLDFYFPENKKIWLYGCLNTKDYETVIKNLFKDGETVFINDSFSKNAVSHQALEQKILENCKNAKIYKSSSIKNSLEMVLSNALESEMIVIAGSLYLTGCIIEELKNSNL